MSSVHCSQRAKYAKPKDCTLDFKVRKDFGKVKGRVRGRRLRNEKEVRK